MDKKHPYEFGKERDSRIIQLVAEATYIDRSQIQQILFSEYDPKYAKRKCQDRVSFLAGHKFINCDDTTSPYSYYPITRSRKPTQIHHFILINEIYCELLRQKKDYMEVEWKWRYEICNGMVVADAYFVVFLEPNRKKPIKVFLEVERDPTKRFDKDVQYERVFATDWHLPPHPEWVVAEKNPFNPSNVRTVFPSILIITNKPVQINSPNKLRFLVHSMEEVKKDIISLIRR